MSRANPRYRRRNFNLAALTNDILRVKVVGMLENQVCVSSFFYKGPSLVNNCTQANLTDLGAGFVAAGNMLTKYLAACSSDYTLSQVNIDCPTTPSLAPLITTQVGSGGGPAGHLPTEMAVVLIKQTAVRGQCGRGRVSIPAVPTAWVTASKLTTVVAHNNLATQMEASITAGADTFFPCIYSAKGSRVFPVPGYAAITLVQLAAGSLLGTVRRRKIGRGK